MIWYEIRNHTCKERRLNQVSKTSYQRKALDLTALLVSSDKIFKELTPFLKFFPKIEEGEHFLTYSMRPALL